MTAGQIVEARFIAAVIKDSAGDRFEECRELPPIAFSDPVCARAWAALLKAPDFETGQAHCDVRKFFVNETLGEAYREDRDYIFLNWLSVVGLDRVDEWRAALPTGKKKLLARMLACEHDPANPPKPDVPIFYVGEKLTNTTGNLGVISSPAKTGKTAIIGAHVAASLKAAGIGSADADTLGIRSQPPESKAVLVIDTEQSPAFAGKLIERALERVGVGADARPAWLRLFSFAGWSAADLTRGLPELMAHASKAHDGIHAVLVDGGADFATNVNDPEEAASLVAGWHALAIRHCCPVIVVVHSNEGAKSDEVARGWLGKQLRRKAESNLQLKRTGEVITLFGESGQRHAPIFEKEGPAFAWDDAAGMHLSVSENPQVSRKLAELQALAAEVYGDSLRMRWKELKEAIKSARGCADSTAENKIKDLENAGIIKNDRMGFKERVLRQ